MVIQESQERIDGDALSGLRGLAALHVVVFHYLLCTEQSVNIQGALEMPLFFLLSGYSLTLGYGRSTYDGNTKYCSHTQSQDEGPVRRFQTFDFFRNRFARIMPMYYFSNFVLGLSLCFIHGVETINRDLVIPNTSVFVNLILCAIDSIFPVGMILPALFGPFVIPGWTISTMWCFYLFFPLLLPILQRFSNDKISRWIVYQFWIQVIIGILLGLIMFVDYVPVSGRAYWLITGWGVARLPVFTMGILSAHHRLRNYSNNAVENRSVFLCCIFAFLPWISSHCSHVECDNMSDDDGTAEKKKHGMVVDIISLIHIIVIVVSPLLLAYANPLGWQDHLVLAPFQLICVNSLLTVIDGLTRDGGYSMLSRVCRSRPLKQLGRISMTLYLIHEPVRCWTVFITEWCTKSKIPTRKMPLWLISTFIFSIPIAWLLTVFFEEPLKNRLRVPVKPPSIKVQSHFQMDKISDEKTKLLN